MLLVSVQSMQSIFVPFTIPEKRRCRKILKIELYLKSGVRKIHWNKFSLLKNGFIFLFLGYLACSSVYEYIYQLCIYRILSISNYESNLVPNIDYESNWNYIKNCCINVIYTYLKYSVILDIFVFNC